MPFSSSFKGSIEGCPVKVSIGDHACSALKSKNLDLVCLNIHVFFIFKIFNHIVQIYASVLFLLSFFFFNKSVSYRAFITDHLLYTQYNEWLGHLLLSSCSVRFMQETELFRSLRFGFGLVFLGYLLGLGRPISNYTFPFVMSLTNKPHSMYTIRAETRKIKNSEK